jgi:hypothetical protein
MKPPLRDDIDTSVTSGLLEELQVAVRAGKLVGLLRGRGLDRSTIEDLLRPESALRLKAILTDHLYPEADHGTADCRCQGGKVLVYRRKEGCGP